MHLLALFFLFLLFCCCCFSYLIAHSAHTNCTTDRGTLSRDELRKHQHILATPSTLASAVFCSCKRSVQEEPAYWISYCIRDTVL
ncbi:hypothetical protein BDF14DRAFT_1847652 [Spinellus fusiger]|nr:hypothetical protein BDF14DRAFT_1847652 [Spinellus fusiger]